MPTPIPTSFPNSHSAPILNSPETIKTNKHNYTTKVSKLPPELKYAIKHEYFRRKSIQILSKTNKEPITKYFAQLLFDTLNYIENIRPFNLTLTKIMDKMEWEILLNVDEIMLIKQFLYEFSVSNC